MEKGLGNNISDLHIMTVGGKVYAAEHTAKDTEMARILCGGHGNELIHVAMAIGYLG